MQLGLLGKFTSSSVYSGICKLDICLFILPEVLYLVNIFMGLGFAYSERPVRWWWLRFLYNCLVVITLSQDPGHLPLVSLLHVRVKTHVSHSLAEYTCPSQLNHVLNCFALGVFFCLPLKLFYSTWYNKGSAEMRKIKREHCSLVVRTVEVEMEGTCNSCDMACLSLSFHIIALLKSLV